MREGFLTKKGKDNGRWAKRFVILKGDKLHYFVQEKDVPNSPKDSLPLLATTLCICSEKIDRPYSFQLTYNRRNYFFSADDGKLLMDWINCIRAAKAKCLGVDEAVGDPAQLQRVYFLYLYLFHVCVYICCMWPSSYMTVSVFIIYMCVLVLFHRYLFIATF